MTEMMMVPRLLRWNETAMDFNFHFKLKSTFANRRRKGNLQHLTNLLPLTQFYCNADCYMHSKIKKSNINSMNWHRVKYKQHLMVQL